MKALIYLLVLVGGYIGAYIPVWLWHAQAFSAWSILGSAIGGLAGIWAAVKISADF